MAIAALAPAPAWAGVRQVLLESGPYELSIDGAGSATNASASLTITRPTAGSRVHRVFAEVSSVWGRGDPGARCLEVDGIGLTLDELESDAWVHARFDDVTDELRAYLDALPVGSSRIPVRDLDGRLDNDGHSLFVVWEDPSFPEAVVSLSLGSVLTGNDPSLVLRTEPVDATAPDFHVDLGVGISFSASPQYPSQVSELAVNGVTVARTAGGFDDGECADGGLYTIGGDGDGPDAERYDITAFVDDGDTEIAVDLFGGTMDDLLFAMWVWAPGTTLDCSRGPDGDGDGVGDVCDACEGEDDALDADEDGVPDGCDVCPGFDDAIDGDGDGAIDGCDVCPGFDDAADGDGDGAPDGCDVCVGSDDGADADRDGIADGCDVCPGFDDGLDSDGDGAIDGCDVCPGFDDAADGDGDGVADGCDACPAGDDHADADGDGAADACDRCPGTDGDGDGEPDPCTALAFLSPKEGPVEGGFATRILGVGFDPSCAAWFDGVPAPVGYLGPTELSAVPPAHDAGLVDVAVSCARGEATLGGGYTYAAGDPGATMAPELHRVLPNVVGTAGGDVVEAEGLGFTPGTVALVDGAPALVVAVHGERLSLRTPPHGAGPAAITVENPDGLADTLEGALLYVASEDEEAVARRGGGTPAGCATVPGGGWLAALVAAVLGLRRRGRWWPLLGLLGCSEYQLEAQVEPALPTASRRAPIALTGPALRVTRDVAAELDGTASTDPDADPPALAFSWTVTGAPAGTAPRLSDPASPRPTLAADTLGVYVVSLEVVDADGLSSSNPAAQVVEVVPWEELEVTLSWAAPVDLDLHLLAPGAAYYGPGDCFFGNPAPDWGFPGDGGDDPWLSTDDDGRGPSGLETVRLPRPEEGAYTLVVVYWNDRGQPVAADATLEVRGAGELLAAVPVRLEAAGDAVVAGAVDWTTLGWAADGRATTHGDLGGPPFNE